MGVGVLTAGEVGNVILYVDGLCIEAMWMLEANLSDITGEAGVKVRVMKGMARVFLGKGHNDVTEVALDREDGDLVEEKSGSLSHVMEAESSTSESAASGELAKQARSVCRLRICERQTRAAQAIVARMAVLIFTPASLSVSGSSKRADKGLEG
jgi:hypothetical protein